MAGCGARRGLWPVRGSGRSVGGVATVGPWIRKPWKRPSRSARIEEAWNTSFDSIIFTAERYPKWADVALARVAVVVGPVDEIRYCGDFLATSEDRRMLLVEVVVITDDEGNVLGEFQQWISRYR